MSPEFWAIIATGSAASLVVSLAIASASQQIERRLDRLIEEVRYPNLEAQSRDMMGSKAYEDMVEML